MSDALIHGEMHMDDGCPICDAKQEAPGLREGETDE